MLRYPEDYVNIDEFKTFCHDRNFCIHKVEEINQKTATHVITHISRRALIEDFSSLDVEHIDTNRIEIFRKIRPDPIVKRIAIRSSNKTKKVFNQL